MFVLFSSFSVIFIWERRCGTETHISSGVTYAIFLRDQSLFLFQTFFLLNKIVEKELQWNVHFQIYFYIPLEENVWKRKYLVKQEIYKRWSKNLRDYTSSGIRKIWKIWGTERLNIARFKGIPCFLIYPVCKSLSIGEKTLNHSVQWSVALQMVLITVCRCHPEIKLNYRVKAKVSLDERVTMEIN